MMRLSRRYVVLGSIAAMILLGGCGFNGGTGSAPPASVTLRIEAASYRMNDTVTVTIMNQSQQTVSFADHQSSCSVILLERQNGSAWDHMAPCRLTTQTRLLSLDAGQSMRVSIPPPGQWPGGQYHARLDFTEPAGT